MNQLVNFKKKILICRYFLHHLNFVFTVNSFLLLHSLNSIHAVQKEDVSGFSIDGVHAAQRLVLTHAHEPCVLPKFLNILLLLIFKGNFCILLRCATPIAVYLSRIGNRMLKLWKVETYKHFRGSNTNTRSDTQTSQNNQQRCLAVVEQNKTCEAISCDPGIYTHTRLPAYGPVTTEQSTWTSVQKSRCVIYDRSCECISLYLSHGYRG